MGSSFHWYSYMSCFRVVICLWVVVTARFVSPQSHLHSHHPLFLCPFLSPSTHSSLSSLLRQWMYLVPTDSHFKGGCFFITCYLYMSSSSSWNLPINLLTQPHQSSLAFSFSREVFWMSKLSKQFDPSATDLVHVLVSRVLPQISVG